MSAAANGRHVVPRTGERRRTPRRRASAASGSRAPAPEQPLEPSSPSSASASRAGPAPWPSTSARPPPPASPGSADRREVRRLRALDPRRVDPVRHGPQAPGVHYPRARDGLRLALRQPQAVGQAPRDRSMERKTARLARPNMVPKRNAKVWGVSHPGADPRRRGAPPEDPCLGAVGVDDVGAEFPEAALSRRRCARSRPGRMALTSGTRRTVAPRPRAPRGPPRTPGPLGSTPAARRDRPAGAGRGSRRRGGVGCRRSSPPSRARYAPAG